MADADLEVRQAVRDAGRRRAEAQQAARDAAGELAAAILAAHAAGVAIATIARDGGVSRQAVYDILSARG